MHYGKQAPIIAALCLIASLSLVALMAPAAQAEGEFTIGGKTLKELGLKEESIAGTFDGTAKFIIPGLKAEIVCESNKVTSATIIVGGASSALFLFSACSVTGVPVCNVDPIELKFVGTLLLHAGQTYFKFGSKIPSEPIETLVILGAECPLPKEEAVTGTAAALIEAGERVKQPLTSISDEKGEKLLGVGLFLNKQPGFLTYSALWELSGPNKGKIWGAK